MALFKRRVKTSDNALNKNNQKNFLVKAVSLIKGISDNRESFSAPEYDLDEIKIASESDSYLKAAIMKYSYMLFKAGYNFKGKNPDAVKYVKTRLKIMSYATNKPIDILFQEIGDDLIKYSNAFLVKSRVPKIMPGVDAIGFFNTMPVGGYFRVDPVTMNIIRDKYGTIKKYIQIVDGEEKPFQPSEVIHFYLDKEAANAFGTPRFTTALEDIKILRRLEGNSLAMVYRFSMPLYHWKIGLPQPGFQATDKEINQTRSEIENMALDGSIVTNERVNIATIGAEGSAMNITPYLSYFENRVFSALGVSQSQMGRGGAKQDADSMESQAHDTVKYIQKIFAIFVEHGILTELLLEGGFNPIVNDDDIVTMEFNEINLDTKIKVENHEMAKYQGNVTTFKEMRRNIGMEEEANVDELYKMMIENEASKEIDKNKADQSIRIATATKDLDLRNSKTSASQTNSNKTSAGTKGVSPVGNGTSKSQAPTKDVENKNTPENQYGKTSVNIKESSETNDVTRKNIKNYKKNFNDIYNKYRNLRNDIMSDHKNADVLMPMAYSDIIEDTKIFIQEKILEGEEKAISDISSKDQIEIVDSHTIVPTKQLENMAKDSLNKTFKELKARLDTANDISDIEAIFNAMEYRIRFMLQFVLPKAYWYSYLLTLKKFHYKKAYVQFDGSSDSKKYKSTINLNAIDLDSIPPFHPYCDCKIKLKKGGNV